jgi:ATP-dependent 26S proteasome regulatory subunit
MARARTVTATALPLRPFDSTGLTNRTTPAGGLSTLTLSPELRAELERVIAEQSAGPRLLAAGFAPSKRVLLVGEPGTGKSSAAAAIATELAQPLHRANLASLVGTLMGETGRLIRELMFSARAVDGVHLVDEIDSVGRSRRFEKNDSAAQERASAVNVLLQELDHPPGPGLFIATTNLVDVLDPALLRRFDTIITFGLPSAAEAAAVARERCKLVDGAGSIDWDRVGQAAVAQQLSHAVVVRAAARAGKDAVLAEVPLTLSALISSIAMEARRG